MQTEDSRMNRQQQAIDDYLQALLREVDDETPDPVPVAEPAPSTLGLDQLVAEIPETVTEAETEARTRADVEAPAEVETEVVAVESVQTRAEPPLVPEWAEQRFQCLLFKVSGLTLAVPLVKLNSVIPWTDKIVETPNQTDWYLGLVNHHDRNVKVIDTALMVLPENRRHLITDDAAGRLSHILLVDDNNWGLACDEIGDVIWLSADQVKWRQNKQKRPWLAGTAVEQMCALMDTEVFAEMLNNQVADEPCRGSS